MKKIKNNLLIQVIDSYQATIENAVELMKTMLGHNDLLSAWMSRKINKESQLTPWLSYKFHGVGCFLIFDCYDINFDFGPNGRCDGFDEWRIED